LVLEYCFLQWFC